jgi:hypothetical protein
MQGRTKLYQRPGSPLIQGQSRRDVPFWKVWLRAVVYGLFLAWGLLSVWLIVSAGETGPGYASSGLDAATGVLTAGLPGLVLGSWLACVLARGMGWRHVSAVAGAIGALVAVATTYAGSILIGWPVVSL